MVDEKRYKELVKECIEKHGNYKDKVFGGINSFDNCKNHEVLASEINLWTFWQGRGHKNVKIMLVGQDWGNPSLAQAVNSFRCSVIFSGESCALRSYMAVIFPGVRSFTWVISENGVFFIINSPFRYVGK